VGFGAADMLPIAFVASASVIAPNIGGVAPILPSFLGSAVSGGIAEPEAVRALSQMRRRPISVAGNVNAPVDTCYWEAPAKPTAANQKAPRVLLLHGADASTLEWRFLVPRLNDLGVSTVAVDWWSGGWTERGAILEQIDAGRPDAPRPWTLVQQHLHAFWRDQLNGEPVVVVGASLGGAVALDFAASHPEAVAGLVLVDAGGESYASPPADVVAAMAPVALGVKRALAFVTNRAPSEELRINSLHRTQPLWSEALGAYLGSGGYARRVGPELIRSLAPPSLVIWGADDPILPVEDAYQFERDLTGCVGVRECDGCGHTPQIDDPDTVARHVAEFCHGLAP